MTEFQLNSILFCDDDVTFRERLLKSAKSKGLQADAVSSVDSALDFLMHRKVDALVLDLRMPEKSGLDLLRSLKDTRPNMRIVVLTGYGSIQTAVDAIRLGAHNYLTKPTSFQAIISSIQQQAGSFETDFQVPSLEQVQDEYVNRILDYNQGNISKAAKDLGLHRRSLQRKLSRH